LRGDVSIAVVAPTQPEDFFDLLWEGVWEATFDLASFGVQVQNLTTDGHDVAAQEAILRRLLDEPVNSIALLPAHADALNAMINELEARGTRVLTFYGDAPASRRSAFVGPDPFHAGVLAGEVLAKLMRQGGRVISFPGAQERSHISQRYEGFRAELASQGRCVEQAFSQPNLDDLTPGLLAELRSADGFYVGDAQLVRVAAVLERAGVSAPCVGFGNTDAVQPFLERKTISAVIDGHRYLQGYFAVQNAYQAALRSDKGDAPEDVRIPSDVAFAANACGKEDSIHTAFEVLIRQRTEILCSYKQKLEQANSELLNLSITDALTGLLNRRRFQEVMDKEAARALRYGPLSLLMIDLNFFKAVNDCHGHQAGDEVLKAVAQLLKSSCRETDWCARLGGDEFAVVLPHSDRQAAAVVRDRVLRAATRTKVPFGAHKLPLSLSIGIATLPEDGGNTESLIAAADASMYRVKQASRASQPAPEISVG
jgi:diguanylate cyclase (GGDEF)-like protein